MRTDEMILVSVDDHVVEPPDMFDRHLPAKYKDLAPKVVQNANGDDVWLYEGQELPNIGLNAVSGKPPEEYGIEPTTFAEMRPGCELPPVLWPAVQPHRGQDGGPRDAPGVQRLAH